LSAIPTVLSEAPQQSLVSVTQIAVQEAPMTEQTVFGARRDDLPINENILSALKRHGFTKPDGQIVNPYKLDENLHFEESISFETGQKMTQLLAK